VICPVCQILLPLYAKARSGELTAQDVAEAESKMLRLEVTEHRTQLDEDAMWRPSDAEVSP